MPLLVAGPDLRSAGSLLDALVEALPAERRPDPATPGAPGGIVRVAGTLAPDTPEHVLRAALGTTTGRSGFAALVDAPDLTGVLRILARQGLSDDEATFMGAVLVVGRPEEAGGEARVTVAHYLRPLLRDAGGHPRRERPAVLAAWDPRGDRWEDFSWGIVPDLALRCEMRAGDLEVERERRAAVLAGLVAARALEPTDLEAAARRLGLDTTVRRD